MSFTRRTGLLATAAVVALALSACAQRAPAAIEPAAQQGSGFPVTIEHLYGTTRIPADPQRIATVSWVNADAVLALGVVPVGMAKDTWGNNEQGSTPWKDAKLTELGAPIGSEKAPVQYDETDGVNFTEMAKLSPDLIVAAYSGMTEEDYAKLSKIAPVIGPIAENYTTSWQQAITAVGKALGRDAQAATTVLDLETQLASAAQEHPVFKDATFIAGNLEPGKGGINLYAGGDNRPRFLASLGMKQAPLVDANTPKGKFFVNWSAERANELDSDVFFTWLPKGTSNESIAAHKLFGQIPAVRKGGLAAISDDTLTLAISASSPLSLPWAMDTMVPLLADAAEAAKASGK
ncbi:ABC transporter substrate-binding protein [Paeniglutamicibacter cryotolerans]|uniref:Iron complex transport system substrate-binding protein n=1 Tax=Paeniglutamicibacter cryotolerans TaxID=670079 RepID=A0A839QMG9_9MICC|nr:ABC transporter substrate-binding protein [Paeniglutamicibacter cryotolerans]MBB2994402.1 iron complex transport system substrate-binding protein [Paeniglutamicibacter cryotolerans]